MFLSELVHILLVLSSLFYPLSSLVCFMVLMYEGDALLSGWALSQRKADFFKPSYWFHTFHGTQSFAIGFESWVWRLFLKAICVSAFVWRAQLFICHFCPSFKLPSLGEALGLQPQFSLKDRSFEKYLGLTRDTKSTSQRAGWIVNCGTFKRKAVLKKLELSKHYECFRFLRFIYIIIYNIYVLYIYIYLILYFIIEVVWRCVALLLPCLFLVQHWFGCLGCWLELMPLPQSHQIA